MANRQLAKSAGSPYLYVADSCEPAIDVLQSKTYYEVGVIDNGVSDPGDVFADAKGNLYVLNYGNGGEGSGNIVEYPPGNWNEPSFTYNANMYDPAVVTVDAYGNVYEGDFGPSSSINEYYQQQNVAASCSTGTLTAVGLAVDGHSDVFAELANSSGTVFELVEYVGGLNTCGQTALPLPSADMERGGNAVLDKNGNLLIANGASVEVVDAPSYSTVNATIGTGFGCANNVTLNKANTLAFVTDICNDTVTIVNYPSGTNAAVLGTGNGIFDPVAAVEHPNAVY